MFSCGPARGSTSLCCEAILLALWRLTGLPTPSLSMARVLSVVECMFYAAVLRDTSSRFRSGTASSKLSLYLLRGYVAPLFGRCNIRGRHSMYT